MTVDEVVLELDESDGSDVNETSGSEDDFEGYLDEDERDDYNDNNQQSSSDEESGSEEDMEEEIPPLLPYTLQPGVCAATLSGNGPLDYFSLDSKTLAPHSRKRQWQKEEHTVAELQKFLALILVMGLVRYPRIESHWSTSWPYATNTFSSVLKRDRFTLLMRFLHLNDNTKYKGKGEPGHDPLFKLRPFLTPLVAHFQSAYTLHRELSIDESMIGYKGRLGFIQYMPKKPTKWGMKAFVLADAHTGYMYNWYLYTGKDDSLASGDVGLTHAVVMKLVQPVTHRGHHVYMDNFYTSPQAFVDLRATGFGACGTLRLNRRGLPRAIKQPVRKGERKVIRLDSCMLAIKWMDKRLVTLLTTIHSNDEVVTVERRSRLASGGRESIEKPKAIDDYNHYMKGVDVADQLLSYYGFSHRTVRWWRRAFFFLVDMAAVNSYVLYTVQNPDRRRRLTHERFRIQLATDLLTAAGVDVASLSPHGRQSVSSRSRSVARLTERHFPTTIGRTDSGRPLQQDCAV